jgi:hypothetical protein
MFIDFRKLIAHRPHDRKLIASFAAAVFAICASGGHCKADEAPKVKKADVGTVEWGGLGWGVGIATNFDVGGKRVGTAELVGTNNIVRVKDASSNVNVSFVLEAHYFLRDYMLAIGNPTSCKKLASAGYVDYVNCTELAHGPFVAIEVGGGSSGTPKADGLITAIAMGWMVGLRHPASSPDSKSSWNFGLGLRVTPNSQILGDGIIANQPLPAGETLIRYKNEPRYGVTLLSSFSF